VPLALVLKTMFVSLHGIGLVSSASDIRYLAFVRKVLFQTPQYTLVECDSYVYVTLQVLTILEARERALIVLLQVFFLKTYEINTSQERPLQKISCLYFGLGLFCVVFENIFNEK